MSIKIKDGHRIDFEKDGPVFVTDDSGERREVDPERHITCADGSFSIPLKGGWYTAANAEEAFVVSQFAKIGIVAGARKFRVAQVWDGFLWKNC